MVTAATARTTDVGMTCALCAEGLQDNDANGTCTTACSHAELACAAWQACDDSTGTVSCGCSAHSTGRHCDECEPGYYGSGRRTVRQGVRLQGHVQRARAARKSKARMPHAPVLSAPKATIVARAARAFPPWRVVHAVDCQPPVVSLVEVRT